ncbi:pyridoxal phosphate-dependent aminotransferase [Desulfovibrio sp. OttesenSCG-928-I05]|nr:pyridoxal phosphate-dependent aminotransferase [Desulfovibrio sp. OttesenSCG-928-I05]
MNRSVCEDISSFLVMEVLEKADALERSGRRIIHLEIGQPDFDTPECINEAAIKAMRDGKTGYTHSMGIWPLREAIAAYYEREYKVNVSPERIMVTAGSSPAMVMVFSAILGQRDTVVMPDPTYACYHKAVTFCGGKVRQVPTLEEEGFHLNIHAMRGLCDDSVAAILVNSPSNPAGSLISPEDLKALCELPPVMVSDEIYHGLVYEGRAASALEYDPDACILDGFAKRYAMTGWRLGWVVLPEHLMNLASRFQQNFIICANSMAQYAGIAALEQGKPHTERMAAEYNRRRVLLLEGLRSLGFGVSSSPAGAFYILANARHLGMDSLPLAFDILEKAGVGCAPGIDFGPGAEGYLRFSYASSVENIEEALHRLKGYLETL